MSSLRVHDHALEYVWIGPRPDEAPTLVFLHEGLGSVSAWRDFPEKLATALGWGALVYSRRGYGASDPLAAPFEPDFLLDEARHDLPAVLAALEVRDYVHVGHSDGGSIALAHARTRPPGLRGLVLEAAHVFVEDVTLASIASLRDRIEPGLVAKLAKHHGANAEPILRAWTGAWLDSRFRGFTLAPALASVAVPALVIQGVDDEYGTLAQVRAIAEGVGARAEMLVLERCGHSPHRDQPGAVLEAAQRFVNSLAI